MKDFRHNMHLRFPNWGEDEVVRVVDLKENPSYATFVTNADRLFATAIDVFMAKKYRDRLIAKDNILTVEDGEELMLQPEGRVFRVVYCGHREDKGFQALSDLLHFKEVIK